MISCNLKKKLYIWNISQISCRFQICMLVSSVWLFWDPQCKHTAREIRDFFSEVKKVNEKLYKCQRKRRKKPLKRKTSFRHWKPNPSFPVTKPTRTLPGLRMSVGCAVTQRGTPVSHRSGPFKSWACTPPSCGDRYPFFATGCESCRSCDTISFERRRKVTRRRGSPAHVHATYHTCPGGTRVGTAFGAPRLARCFHRSTSILSVFIPQSSCGPVMDWGLILYLSRIIQFCQKKKIGSQ